MKIFGWLWAWLREYTDCVYLASAIGCTAAFGATYWFPFAVAAIVLACAAIKVRCLPKRRKRAQWAGDHPAVRAAARRELQTLEQWWDLPAADDAARKEQQ